MAVHPDKPTRSGARSGKRGGALLIQKSDSTHPVTFGATVRRRKIADAVLHAAEVRKHSTSVIDMVNKSKPGDMPYTLIALQTLHDDAVLVTHGMKPWVIKRVASDLNIEISRFVDSLKISRSTYHRKIKNASSLNVYESERVLGVAKLVGQVKAMLADNEAAEGFDAAAWVGNWLEEPLPALGNRKPIEWMESSSGREFVLQLLVQAQTGSYA